MRTVLMNEDELRQLIAESVGETLESKLPGIIRKAKAKEWLTPTDIEKEYKLTRRSQHYLREKKRLQYRKVSKRIICHRSEIERYFESIKISKEG